MKKITTIFKRLFLGLGTKPWPAYLVLAGLGLQTVYLTAPVVVAQSRSPLDYSLVALQPIANPNWKDTLTVSDVGYSIFQNNIFVQAFFTPNVSNDKKTDIRPVKIIASIGTVIDKRTVIVTAYSSTPDQTDSTPFITANGAYVYDGLVACNFLPFGTKVKFPEIYGNKIFMVEDRMATYNSHKIDIWMPSRELALQFGVKRLAVEVVK